MPCFIYLWLFCVSYMLLLPTVSGFCSFMLKYSSAHLPHTSRQFECLGMFQCGLIRLDQMQRRRADLDRMGPYSECDFMLWQYHTYDGLHGIPLWPKNRGDTLSLEWHITLPAFILSCFPVCSFLIICLQHSHNVPCIYTCWLCAQTMEKQNLLRALLWTSNARRKLIFGL